MLWELREVASHTFRFAWSTNFINIMLKSDRVRLAHLQAINSSVRHLDCLHHCRQSAPGGSPLAAAVLGVSR